MKKVPIKVLGEKIVQKLLSTGLDKTQAQIVSDALVYADACGICSHGTIRLQHYISRIAAGGINIQSTFPVSEGKYAWSKIIDAQGGLGHAAAFKAAEIKSFRGKNTRHIGCFSNQFKPLRRAFFLCADDS